MYRLIVILIFVFFISCNKNNQNSISQEKDNMVLENVDTENVIENIDLLTNETNIENVPKIMYVISKEGLNKRSEPSINGDITGVLLYGERVITHEKSETVDTINGITEYWYRVKFHVNINEWIFGGYISENLPSDLPIILGKWDNINRQRENFVFSPNHDYMNGLKESSNGIWGSWELNENNIRVFNLRAGEDYLAVNGKLANDEENITLEIKDDNNIVLIFSGGRIVELTRSSDLW